jgi:GNAT superfamily N-acetyltransferase
MSAMGWRTTGGAAEFLAVAGDYLRAERARNTVLLTVTAGMQANRARYHGGPDAGRDPARSPLLGWWTGPAGEVGGAFLHTPPFPLLLTAVTPSAAAELALALAGRPLAGVNAVPAVAEAFAGFWRDATGYGAGVHRRERLYRLAELSRPAPAPDGVPRVAGDSDAALLTGWFTAFTREAHEMGGGEDQAAAVADRLSYRGVTVWEAGGVPASFAGVSRQVAGMVRVGPVYTPPELRGRGYASAVTAAVSQQALDAGAAEVLLFTDLANPVSNSIYQRIGYRAVEDRTVLAFGPASP